MIETNIRDVERISRDVFQHAGGRWFVVAVQPADRGWHLIVGDTSGARTTLLLPAGAPAAIRARVSEWVDTQN
jgi:hypothetical protein